MPIARVTANANTGAWTQATTEDVNSKNVYITNSVGCEYVFVFSGTAADENTANRVGYNPTTGITVLTNANPCKIWIRAQAGIAGSAFIRWD